MKSSVRTVFSIALIVAAAAGTALLRADALAAGGTAQKSKDKPPAPGPSVFVEDRGTFQVKLDGQPAGTEEFEIHANAGAWTARGVAEVPGENGASSKVTGKLDLAPDGAPLRYEWSATSPRKAAATILFQGTLAKMELKMEGASLPLTQEFNFPAPPVVILDNNMYHQYAVLARIYDWEHKEQKTYAVLIPQDLTPGSITVDYTGPQIAEGQKFETLRVRSADLEIELYCDPAQQGRLMRLEVPAAKVVIVRQSGKK
jgi:hypothetical protein